MNQPEEVHDSVVSGAGGNSAAMASIIGTVAAGRRN
jgi:hypothetical protein